MLPEILFDLEVRHTKTNPVFVIGSSRSGTSILVKMIRKYLKISFGTESQFIIRYYNNLLNSLCPKIDRRSLNLSPRVFYLPLSR
jgi:ABC-type ATPase involved in cell division